MTERKVTLEEVLAKRTPRGSFTREQIEAWGIEWPPGHGWVKRLTGDPNAKIPMPGRTPVAIDLARKTRLDLEREVVELTATVKELRDRIAELEAVCADM
jgi:hypothetical protein